MPFFHILHINWHLTSARFGPQHGGEAASWPVSWLILCILFFTESIVQILRLGAAGDCPAHLRHLSTSASTS